MKIAFNVGEFLVKFHTKIMLNVKQLYYMHSRSGYHNSRNFSKSLKKNLLFYDNI